MGESGARLKGSPRSGDWLELSVFLQAIEAIRDELHGGDSESLYRALYEDTVEVLPGGSRLLLRGLGVRRALNKTPGLHRRLYDVGRAEVKVERRRAVLSFRGSALFEEPTWQWLQGAAVRMLFDLAHARAPRIEARGAGANAHDLIISW